MLGLALVAALTLVAGGVASANIPDSGTGVFHGCVDKSTGALRLVDPSKGQGCGGAEQTISWSGASISWKGSWSSSTAYVARDAVSYGGSSYIATSDNTDALPPGSAKWSLLASQGIAGVDGSTIIHGEGVPSNSVGTRGDLYLDTTAHVLYGPKFRYCHAKGCTYIWPAQGTALVGPPGPAGDSDVLNHPGGDVPLIGFHDTSVVELSNIPAGDYLVVATVYIGNSDSSPQNGNCELYVNYDGSLSGDIDDVTVTIPGAGDTASSSDFTLQGTVRYDPRRPGYAILACNTYNGEAYDAHISAIHTSAVIGDLG